VAPAALAQTPDNPFLRGRYTAVTERPQGAFDPEAVRVGVFELWSSLGLSAEHNDNVFATESLAESDTLFRIQPEAELRSNWSSHELALGAAVDHREYAELDSETTTDYSAYARGRIDVLRSFQLHGRVLGEHNTEARYEPASATSPEPAQFDVFGAEAGATFRRDRLMLDGRVGTRDSDFDDAVFNFRDVTETYFNGRASYAVSPDVALFVQGRSSELDYDTTSVPNRDGTRSSAEVGVSFELQAPFRGEIAVGSLKDEKDDPTLSDTDGLSVNASVTWFPTQLTTVTFRANRSTFDPGLLISPTATNTTLGVRVDHELRRNIVLFGDVSAGKYDFEDITREDEFANVEVGAAYKLNKHARIEASYRYHGRTEDVTPAPDIDITQNIFAIGLRIYP
jgi:hypothetical protein